MEINVKRTLSVTIEGEDIDTLRKAFKKVVEEITKPGLKNNTITTDEADIIKDFTDKIK